MHNIPTLKWPDLPSPVVDAISTDRDRLVENYPIHIDVCGADLAFEIFAGYENDRASVPWAIRWLYDRSSFGIKACLVHDFLLDLIASEQPLILRDGGTLTIEKWQADLIFYLIMLRDGIEPRVAFHGYLAVLVFG